MEEVGNGLKVSRATHTECEAEEEPLKRSFPYVRSNTNRGAADQQQEIKYLFRIFILYRRVNYTFYEPPRRNRIIWVLVCFERKLCNLFITNLFIS